MLFYTIIVSMEEAEEPVRSREAPEDKELAGKLLACSEANYQQNGQNYYFFATLDNGEDLPLTSNEGILKWFSLDEVNDLKMPFTSEYVMKHYVSIGQYNNLIYGGIATVSSVLFSELSDEDIVFSSEFKGSTGTGLANKIFS